MAIFSRSATQAIYVVGYLAENIIRDLRPIGGHAVDACHGAHHRGVEPMDDAITSVTAASADDAIDLRISGRR